MIVHSGRGHFHWLVPTAKYANPKYANRNMNMFNDQDENHLYRDLYLREEPPPHPGDILRDDILPLLGLSRVKVARALGIGPRKLSSVIAGKTPVTLDLALRLGTVLGHGPRYWLGLQMQHDLWYAAQPNASP